MSKERETDVEDTEQLSQETSNESEDSNLELKEDGDTVVVTENKMSRREVREQKHREQRQKEMAEFMSPIMAELRALKQSQQAYRQPIIPQQPQQQQREQTRDERNYDAVYDEMVDVQTELNTPGISESRVRELTKKYRELSRESIRIESRIAAREEMKNIHVPQQQQRQQDPIVQAESEELYRYAPTVMRHPRALAMAHALYSARQERGEINSDNSLDMQKECLDLAANEFNLKTRAPTQSQKARFGGSRSVTGANGGGGYKLSERSIDMAISANPGMPKDKAIQKWVKEQLSAGNTLADLA